MLIHPRAGTVIPWIHSGIKGMKSIGSGLRRCLLQVILGVGNGPSYLQFPLVLCSVNRGIANFKPCFNITQSSPYFYNPSKEKMSKAQVKVLEHLAGFWSLYVGNLPDYILQTQILEDPFP